MTRRIPARVRIAARRASKARWQAIRTVSLAICLAVAGLPLAGLLGLAIAESARLMN